MDAAQAGSSTAAGTPAGAATSTTPPGAAATPVASAGLGSLGAAAGAGSGAPAAPMPLGPPPTPAPAAPASSTTSGQTAAAGQPSGTAGPSGPGVYPASAKDAGQVGAPAPIPVTAARAEREFLARATAAGAARRQSGGHDRLSLAKRIAAALNAPDQPGRSDHNFFWVTGVSTDGQIVVANSYGMAYIPDGVDLPNPVRLVSADAAVPAPLRARWTTYPFAAIAAWAAHHEVGLRAVIATEAQFAGVDPGAPKDVLHDDDIPPSGKMAGRHRLAVVDPATAAELAAVADWNLLELMPTAPVAADPPTDRRGDLWWDINKPTMSQASDRGDAQLKLFVPYVEHCMELALHQAHTGIHAQLQRQAVTDWYYWRFLHELLTEALTGAAAP